MTSKKTIGLNKIEIDDKTSEPKIIKVREDLTDPSNTDIKQNKSEKLNQTSVGKQLVMTRILGFSEQDKNIDKRQKALKHIVTVIFLVFVIGVLGYTFYSDFFESPHEPVSWQNLLTIFENTWFYLLCALLSLAVTFLVKGAKLSVICHSQTKTWHYKTCFETGIIGHYYNSVTPLAVGGQPFEIYHLSKHGIHGGVASSMPIIAFFFGQLAFVSLGIVSLVFFNDNTLNIPNDFMVQFPALFNVLAIIGLSTCFLMPFLVVLFSLLPKVGAKLVGLFACLGGKFRFLKDPKKTAFRTLKTIIHNARCIKKFAQSPFALIATFVLSLIETSAMCSIAYFSLKFFGYDNPDAGGFLEWLQILQLSVILYAAISFIPTPGNSGAADLSFYLLFSVGLTVAGLAFTAMAVWRILSYYSYIVIGFIFTTANKKRNHKLEFLGISDLDD